MKKLILLCSAFMVVAATVVTVLGSQQKYDAVSKSLITNVEALTQNEEGSSCKWKEVRCNGNRIEVCVTNGDGNSCNCGDVTRDC